MGRWQPWYEKMRTQKNQFCQYFFKNEIFGCFSKNEFDKSIYIRPSEDDDESKPKKEEEEEKEEKEEKKKDDDDEISDLDSD